MKKELKKEEIDKLIQHLNKEHADRTPMYQVRKVTMGLRKIDFEVDFEVDRYLYRYMTTIQRFLERRGYQFTEDFDLLLDEKTKNEVSILFLNHSEKEEAKKKAFELKIEKLKKVKQSLLSSVADEQERDEAVRGMEQMMLFEHEQYEQRKAIDYARERMSHLFYWKEDVTLEKALKIIDEQERKLYLMGKETAPKEPAADTQEEQRKEKHFESALRYVEQALNEVTEKNSLEILRHVKQAAQKALRSEEK